MQSCAVTWHVTLPVPTADVQHVYDTAAASTCSALHKGMSQCCISAQVLIKPRQYHVARLLRIAHADVIRHWCQLHHRRPWHDLPTWL